MNLKRIILIVAIVIIFFVCYKHMNVAFDRLSRYPYQNENDRRLIDEYLTDDEIEYIIEYSIAPVHFIKYIEYDGFNIYHIDLYQHIENLYWYLNDEQIVSYTEQVLSYENGYDTAISLHNNYNYLEILNWLEYGDKYNPSSEIISNPESVLAYLDDEHTMTNRVPYDLVEVDGFNNDKVFLLKRNAAEAYKNMCEALSEEFKRANGGLIIEKAYVSYDEQVIVFEECKAEHPDDYLKRVDYPGHSEHQLGLAIDISFRGYENMKEAPQYDWILNHAHEYGFVQTRVNQENKEDVFGHFRYVGVELATQIFDEQISLKEAIK